MHGLADKIFAEHWTEGRPPIALTRKRRKARTLQLNVPASALSIDNLSEEDGTPIPQLRDEVAKLMPSVCHGKGLSGWRNEIAGEDHRPRLRLKRIKVNA